MDAVQDRSRLATLASALERGLTYVLLYWCVGLLALALLAWAPVAFALRLLLPRALGQRVGQCAARNFFRFYVANLRATGYVTIELDELAALRNERGVVIVANHPCLLDALMIVSQLPHAVCLMKAELESSIFWGAPARLAGYVGNANFMASVRTARERIAEGAQLVVFPEGTRTSPFPLGEFKGGAAVIATQAQVPVQALLIDTNTRYLSKGWPLLKLPRLPLYWRIRLGRRFAVPANSSRFLEDLRAYYLAELPSLRTPGDGDA